MHDGVGAHYLSAKCLPNRLMSEADTQDWHLARKMLDQLNADARILRCARSGRDHDPLRAKLLDLLDGGLIVAAHHHLLTCFSDVLHQVEGERVVVVEDKHH